MRYSYLLTAITFFFFGALLGGVLLLEHLRITSLVSWRHYDRQTYKHSWWAPGSNAYHG